MSDRVSNIWNPRSRVTLWFAVCATLILVSGCGQRPSSRTGKVSN